MGNDRLNEDERPLWAKRIRAERAARGWSQTEAVRVLRAHGDETLPGDASILRNWKRWEAGEAEPDDFYKKLISKSFGTVTAAFFPTASHRDANAELLAGSGLNTLELLSRVRASDVSTSTLDALRITADRLCCEYPYMPSAQLQVEGRAWLQRITTLLNGRMTLTQHRELLSLAGLVALLLGCVEYDMGLRRDAETTRRAALSLGQEADDQDVMGWAQEMRAWYALTQGDYRVAVSAGQSGEAVASGRSVAVQLAAQQAKAWARMGDRRQVELALERGRNLLEVLPEPEDTDHHFVVDPEKFDFYAMDCYRIAREDQLAELYAHEVIRSSTNFDGTFRKPMRVAEANVTLGVIAARSGNLEEAVALGRRALEGDRQSMPSLLMCSRELTTALDKLYPNEQAAKSYVEQVQAIAAAS
jgi:tetratricopeptide (TPR) repeat protein